ncbi:Flp family type IVb pilin [Sinomonas sp. JGH33]|uniref:Flp family type IVb pilin n=1 Tax=Sinomonas terricola TaxID=3110330 RepID=A0ABU5T199_9MICC|nr:Flp family type IVb pilin [Sinomonas sp. JGH33]MEA5453430.1 Flp family type IVb pilin [Sinomonas sp. JGH33]
MKDRHTPPIASAAGPDESGSTSTEYAVLVGFIAFAITAGATIFGTALGNVYFTLAHVLSSMLNAK